MGHLGRRRVVGFMKASGAKIIPIGFLGLLGGPDLSDLIVDEVDGPIFGDVQQEMHEVEHTASRSDPRIAGKRRDAAA